MWERRGHVHCARCRRRRVAKLVRLVHDQGGEAIGPALANPAAVLETSVKLMVVMADLGVSICDFVAKSAVATNKDACCIVLVKTREQS